MLISAVQYRKYDNRSGLLGLHGKEECSMLCPAVSAHFPQLDTTGPVQGSGTGLFGLDARRLAQCMVGEDQPAFRGRQLAEAMYRQWVADLSAITTLPGALRTRLAAQGWAINRPQI